MAKKNFWHNMFGTTPGKGIQPKEVIAYSVTGFGCNGWSIPYAFYKNL